MRNMYSQFPVLFFLYRKYEYSIQYNEVSYPPPELVVQKYFQWILQRTVIKFYQM